MNLFTRLESNNRNTTMLICYAFIIVSILFHHPKVADCQNACSFDKIEMPVYPISRVVLRYECFSGNEQNPAIPIDHGSYPSEFNELDLSPNLFARLPTKQLCTFSNLFSLDLSSNLIQNMSGGYAALSCLRFLINLDLSSNEISTPMLASDFDDHFGELLRTLNLNNNRIPSIETGVFFSTDKTRPRFPHLVELSLSNNRIKTLDLLFPMILPSPTLKVNLSNNPIANLENQLALPFDATHLFEIAGQRSVDLRNNSLKSLSDSNLLQYGLESSHDLAVFLSKIRNFDFRQAENMLNCSCPRGGSHSHLVDWYRNMSIEIQTSERLSGPIWELKCANMNDSNFIFDFDCPFTETSSETTATNSTSHSLAPSHNSSLSNQTVKMSNLSAQSLKNSSQTSVQLFVNSIGLNNSGNLFLLFLLIVPLLLVLLLLAACCYGKWCANLLFRKLSIRLCSTSRKDEPQIYPANNNNNNLNQSSDAQNSDKKKKDKFSIVLFNESDEIWLEKRFLPPLYENLSTILIKKISSSSLSQEQEQDLKENARRIVLILSKNFINEQAKSAQYLKCVQQACANHTPDFALIIVSVGEVNDQDKSSLLENLFDNKNDSKLGRLLDRIIGRVRRNCGIDYAETLDYHDQHFWPKLFYLMPPVCAQNQNQEKPVVEPKKYNQLHAKLPSLNMTTQAKSNATGEENELSMRKREKKHQSSIKRKIHPNVGNAMQLVREDMDFWQKISAISPDFYANDYEYEPIGEASINGNAERNVTRFGTPSYDEKIRQKLDYNMSSFTSDKESNFEEGKTGIDSLKTGDSSSEKKKKFALFSNEKEANETGKKNRQVKREYSIE